MPQPVSIPPGVRLDPNTATATELENVRGIGPVLAGRIIAARPFKTADDLRKVKGIGTEEIRTAPAVFSVKNFL